MSLGITNGSFLARIEADNNANIFVIFSVDIYVWPPYGGGMSNDDYGKALAAAQKELDTLNNQAEIIERRRAQLQQTISSLKTLMHVAEDEERTLTDCIRIAVKGAQGYISAADVLKTVVAMGAPFSGKNMIDSVVTILNRLQKQNELLRDPNGKGYMWAGYVLERLAAMRFPKAVDTNLPKTPAEARERLVDAVRKIKDRKLV